ncbi:hypothetical protein CHS0354_016950 [Potamilus streckersoni]|uniref:SSD domain-containing protein n=1 Tax=Potamilus streckersoni TaxID=2493646 RepID=A0AAE0S7K1_9BIVA|nr:hypothetical protein CHS0354_016950 [Potamilus streckersoni]
MLQNTFYNFYEKTEHKTGAMFACYGRYVARNPWKFIFVPILLNGLLSIGMIRLHVERDLVTVYTPINSDAIKDSERVKILFPDLSGTHFVGVQQLPDLGCYAEVIIRAVSGNVLEPNILAEVEKLYNFVLETTINNGGGSINYTDICARNVFGCNVEGAFFFSPEFISAVVADNITFPYIYQNTVDPIYYENMVGAFVFNETHLISAQMLRLRFNIRTDKTDFYNWQNEFIFRMNSFSSRSIEITYMHSRSMAEELDKNIQHDVFLFAITFAVMIIYICFATFTARCDVVGQRINLGYPGIIAAFIAIPSSYGIVSACGVSFISIVGMVPFLIIGVGVDAMFVMLSGLAGAQSKGSVEDKIAETMRTSGVAITITSVTDCLAFLAGASSVFLSVRNFCIYTGVAVIICYLNQATLFLACLTLHEKRVESNRHCMTCFPVISKKNAKEQGLSGQYILCCSGSPPTSRNEAESCLDKFPGWLIPKVILKFPVKIIILHIFAGYLAISIYGITTIKQDLDIKNLVSPASYLYKYRQWLDDNFRGITYVSFVIPQTVSYSSNVTEDAIDTLLKNAKYNPSVKDNFQISWLSSYKQSEFYNDSSEDKFVTNLEQSFLTYPLYQRFKNDLVIDSVAKRITASRFYVISENLESTEKQGQLMLDMRVIAKSSSLSTFAFSPDFIFYEQYLKTFSQTVQKVGIAVIIVFLLIVLFMPHPLLVIFITGTLVMIMVGILGFIPFLGITFSTITMIQIIMSVGFSVDYAAHLCHGFMVSDFSSREERVKQALIRSGAPIFHGAVTSFLGIIIFAADPSYIFRSFFMVRSLAIIFGFAHTILFLPVVLSFIGPHKAVNSSNQRESMQNYKLALEVEITHF